MAAVRLSTPLKIGWWLHRKLYRLTGGRMGRRSNGFEVLLLTTIGRKSGQPRDVALQCVEHGSGWAVIASYAGEDRDPTWRQNLLAEPMAEVRVRSVVAQVRARDAEGDERAELWRQFVAVDDAYDIYQQRTRRRLPVVVLERTSRT